MIQRVESRGDVAAIFIPQGDILHECIVDSSDLDLVISPSCFWSVTVGKNGLPYVGGCVRHANGNSIGTTLQRHLLGEPLRCHVDHKDGDTLNFRRTNLRAVPPAINILNRVRLSRNNTTGMRGVYRGYKGWSAGLQKKKLGCFPDPRDAAERVWMEILKIDPISASNYLKSLPDHFDVDRFPIFPNKRTYRRSVITIPRKYLALT